MRERPQHSEATPGLLLLRDLHLLGRLRRRDRGRGCSTRNGLAGHELLHCHASGQGDGWVDDDRCVRPVRSRRHVRHGLRNPLRGHREVLALLHRRHGLHHRCGLHDRCLFIHGRRLHCFSLRRRHRLQVDGWRDIDVGGDISHVGAVIGGYSLHVAGHAGHGRCNHVGRRRCRHVHRRQCGHSAHRSKLLAAKDTVVVGVQLVEGGGHGSCTG
mmetsp:Transcript_7587/g.15793  ORF Transcript_7587/g.15793 Transcript_7587/m.15793 type:complete len:214 (+) Transcript_7587:65-706(+)